MILSNLKDEYLEKFTAFRKGLTEADKELFRAMGWALASASVYTIQQFSSSWLFYVSGLVLLYTASSTVIYAFMAGRLDATEEYTATIVERLQRHDGVNLRDDGSGLFVWEREVQD